MFNFIDSYIFIPVSGYVGRGPGLCFACGPKMLLGQPCVVVHFAKQFSAIELKNNVLLLKTRYDYNLTIMKSPKPATDNRFK